jgi:hypothetical protein
VNKIEQVVQLVDAGEKPILRFLKTSESGGLEKGQYGRVIGIDYDDADIFALDFSEFWQYNQQLEQPKYYDHKTTLWDAPWHKTKGYPSDYRETYYLDETHCDEFEIVDTDDLHFGIHRAYIKCCKQCDESPDYQHWLETNLINQLMEYHSSDEIQSGELLW